MHFLQWPVGHVHEEMIPLRIPYLWNKKKWTSMWNGQMLDVHASFVQITQILIIFQINLKPCVIHRDQFSCIGLNYSGVYRDGICKRIVPLQMRINWDWKLYPNIYLACAVMKTNILIASICDLKYRGEGYLFMLLLHDRDKDMIGSRDIHVLISVAVIKISVYSSSWKKRKSSTTGFLLRNVSFYFIIPF